MDNNLGLCWLVLVNRQLPTPDFQPQEPMGLGEYLNQGIIFGSLEKGGVGTLER